MAEVPEIYWPAMRIALDELVAGERPELMVWVRRYGDTGAELIRQPDSIFRHPRTDFWERSDGSVGGVAPVWTAAESPSDLSIEFDISPSGDVNLTDLHVL